MRRAVGDNGLDWDDDLPLSRRREWESWKESLMDLETIPRAFTDLSVQGSVRRELHIFSDASKEAIGAVAYLKLNGGNGSIKSGFVLGKSKLAPASGHTIPRLELCAAVMATELSDFISKYLPVDDVYFYTDSKVVLGYVSNETRRFYVYVSNRVDRILKSSSRSQWKYVPTDKNPADQATRPVQASKIVDSIWLKGPSTFIDSAYEESGEQVYELINPEVDSEIRPVICAHKMSVSTSLGSCRFSRFSTWSGLVRGLSFLKQAAATCINSHVSVVEKRTKVDFHQESERLILREVQLEFYQKEVMCLQESSPLPRASNVLGLSPKLDDFGLLRIGGRLSQSNFVTWGENSNNCTRQAPCCNTIGTALPLSCATPRKAPH